MIAVIIVLAFAALILLPALVIGFGVLGSLFINGAELEKKENNLL